MIFKRLEFKNYKTYYGFQDINLNITTSDIENHKNIILFGGLNGAGKTTILKAIRYVLFGERGITAEEKRRVFSNTINDTFFDEGGRECAVALTFQLNASETYHLEVKWLFNHQKKMVDERRTIKQLGKIRPKEIPVTNIDAFNRFIDRYIPYNAAPFFIFDGEEIKDLITKQDKESMKHTIHKITGLDRIKKLLEDLRKIEDSLLKSYAKSTNAIDVKTYQKKLQEKEAQKEEFDAKLTALRKEIRSCELEISELTAQRNKKLSANSVSRDSLIKKQATVQSAIKSKKDKIDRLFDDNILTILLDEKIKNLQSKLREERQIQNKLIKQEELLKPYNEFIDQLLNKEINPPLSSSQLDQIKNMGAKIWLKDDSQSLVTEEPVMLHDLTQKDFNYLLGIKSLDRRHINNEFNELEKLKVDELALESEIADAPGVVDTTEENNKITRLDQRIGELKIKYRALHKKALPLNDEVINLKNKLSRTVQVTESTSDLEEKMNYVQKLTRYYTEYLQRVTDHKLVKIENEFKFMLNKLFRKSNEFNQIVFDVKTYSIRLYNDKGLEVSVFDRSAGEMQLISSSFIWALIKVSELDLPIVIDTPLGRLDSIHRNHLVSQYYTNLSKQVIILSTDTEVTSEYVSIMKNHSVRQFLLDYDESKKYTVIKDGYFNLVKVKR